MLRNWLVGEQCCEMDVVAATAIVIDGGLEVGERVDAVFFLAPATCQCSHSFSTLCGAFVPVKLLHPFLLRINDPLPTDPKLAMAARILPVLIRLFRDWTQLEQRLEVLQLLIFNMQLEGSGLLLRACWYGAEGFS